MREGEKGERGRVGRRVRGEDKRGERRQGYCIKGHQRAMNRDESRHCVAIARYAMCVGLPPLLLRHLPHKYNNPPL
jgi:hypothetical protein